MSGEEGAEQREKGTCFGLVWWSRVQQSIISLLNKSTSSRMNFGKINLPERALRITFVALKLSEGATGTVHGSYKYPAPRSGTTIRTC